MFCSRPAGLIGAGTDRKLVELDAVRGMAALVVLNGHFLGAVAPDTLRLIHATPLGALTNGSTAVMLFLVLSGFVLTLHPLQRRSWRVTLGAALKRWPRLAGPVVVAGLVTVAAAWCGAFPAFGGHRLGPDFPARILWGSQLGARDAGAVLWECAVGTFVTGSAVHNPVLWTMKWELIGSFVVFGMVAIDLLHAPRLVRAGGLVACSGWAVWFNPLLLGFPAGAAAAALHLRLGPGRRMHPAFAAGALPAAGVVMAWDVGGADGLWAWANGLDFQARTTLWAVASCAASLLVLAAALYCVPIRTRLRTGAFAFLGRVSFPLYLTHFVVLLSAGAWFCILVLPDGAGAWATPLLYLLFVATALACATPLMVFDTWWTRRLNRLAKAWEQNVPGKA